MASKGHSPLGRGDVPTTLPSPPPNQLQTTAGWVPKVAWLA